MKKLIAAIILACSMAAQGQTLFHDLGNLLNASDTNGIIFADELNASIGYKRDSDNDLNGGVLKLDWWVTMQQGAFFSYEEFGNQTAYWSLGYQARTVFKKLELTLATGTRQNVDDSFGDVALFMSPSLTYHLVKSKDFDFRLTAGADVVAGTSKPNPYFMATFRFFRF